MFYKFSCGCIGTYPDADGNAYCINACDRDSQDNELSLYKTATKFIGKSYEPLAATEEEDLLNKMGRLIYEGYKFRAIVNLLKD